MLSCPCRRREGRTAAALGKLGVPDQAQAGSNPFAPGSGAAAADSLPQAAVDESESNAEAVAIGLLAAERFAAQLAQHAELAGVTPGLKEVAGNLAGLLRAAAGSPGASGETRERLTRALQLVSPVATAALPPPSAAAAIAPEAAGPSDNGSAERKEGEMGEPDQAEEPAKLLPGPHARLRERCGALCSTLLRYRGMLGRGPHLATLCAWQVPAGSPDGPRAAGGEARVEVLAPAGGGPQRGAGGQCWRSTACGA
jgi:hypothetical protein